MSSGPAEVIDGSTGAVELLEAKYAKETILSSIEAVSRCGVQSGGGDVLADSEIGNFKPGQSKKEGKKSRSKQIIRIEFSTEHGKARLAMSRRRLTAI